MSMFPLFALVGAVFALIIPIGVVLLIVWAVRSRPQSPTPLRETPRQVLDGRFAAGEIDADEYKRSRDLLSGGGPTS